MVTKKENFQTIGIHINFGKFSLDKHVNMVLCSYLQTLFRPVAMMSPDALVVAQVCLYAYGFRSCRDQALRLVSLQTLCSQQLSQQGRFSCRKNNSDFMNYLFKPFSLACKSVTVTIILYKLYIFKI